MTEPVSCRLGLVGRATRLLSTFSGRWRECFWLSPWAAVLYLFPSCLCVSDAPLPPWLGLPCPHLSVISSPGRAPSALSAFPSTVFLLPLWSPLSLLFDFPPHPRSSGEGLHRGSGGWPKASWGSRVMVHVLLCTDRQAQDKVFSSEPSHNPFSETQKPWATIGTRDKARRGNVG